MISFTNSLSEHPCYERLMHLWSRGAHFLGVPYPVLGGAMTWISDHGLVSAIGRAGGFGVLAGGALSPDALTEEIEKTQKAISTPFGVNIITLHPQIASLVEVCVLKKVSHVFFGGGMPMQSHIERLSQADIKVVGFAPTLAIAKKMYSMGVHAIVIEGSEAGGHIGSVSTAVLAQELLLPLRDKPVFVAGGIGNGLGIAAYTFMGAWGCQLGTRFVCAEESIAHPSMKKAFIEAKARDATISVQLDPKFPVIPVRSLENEAKKDFIAYQRNAIEAYYSGHKTRQEAQHDVELYWAGALRNAVIEGDVTRGSLMAGQSVGMVTEIQSCASIMHTLIQETLEHMAWFKHHFDSRSGKKAF